MGRKHTNQIKAGSGLSLSGPYPVDDRTVVEYYTDLTELVNKNCAYNGMQVHVLKDNSTDNKDLNKTYEYNNGNWITYATEADFDAFAKELDGRVTYTNSNAMPYAVGGIKAGTTFSTAKTIQDVLNMLLYPYVDLELNTASPSGGTANWNNCPKISAITLYFKQNNAKDLKFSISGPASFSDILSEATITVNTDSVKFQFDEITINANSTFKITCSYKDDANRNQSQDKYIYYTITFTAPTLGDLSSDFAKTTYYSGETAEATKVTVPFTLNSASGFTKLELYKGTDTTTSTPIKTATNISKSPYTFESLSLKDYLYTPSTTEESKTYTVQAWYDKPTVSTTGSTSGQVTDATTTTSTSITKSFSIKFKYKQADITLKSSSALPTTTRSKLNPVNIEKGSLSAQFTKHSAKIASVKLFADNEDTNTGYVNDTGYITDFSEFNKEDYDSELRSTKFTYERSNICQDLTLKAVALDSKGNVLVSSDPIELTFAAPNCYGFVASPDDDPVTLDKVDLDMIKGLPKSSLSLITNIVYTDPKKDTPSKFLFVSTKKFSAGTDLSGGDILSSMEDTGGVAKEFKLADGTTQTYYIYLGAIASSNAKVNYTFS